jgi:hypothetical protein
VRRGAGHSASLSQLDVRPDRLALAFKLDAWVEEVVKISYAPGKVLADLRFRQPVAWVKPENAQHLHLVDGEGRVLPVEDVDTEITGFLAKITGIGLAPPADARAGVVWKSKLYGGEGEQVDERIVAAAGLARFLKQQGQSGAEISPALQMIEIIVSDFDNRGLFVLNAKETMFCWGRAPGSEGPKELAAMEKWQMLLRWAQSARGQTVADDDYWEISNRGVLLVCAHKGAPHRREERPGQSTSDQN